MRAPAKRSPPSRRLRAGAWLGPALGAYALGHAGHGRTAPSARRRRASSRSRPSPRRVPVAGNARSTARRRIRCRDESRARLSPRLGAPISPATPKKPSTRLHDLFEADRSDPVAAIYLADLEKRAGRPLAAAKVLALLAASVPAAASLTSLHIEAAVLLWRAGERRPALDELEEALSARDAHHRVRSSAGRCAASTRARPTKGRGSSSARAELSDDKQLLSLQHLCLQLFASLPDVETARSLFDGIEVGARGAARDRGVAGAHPLG